MDFRETILSHKENYSGLLKAIIAGIRPGRLESTQFAKARIRELIGLIESDHDCKKILSDGLNHLFKSTSSTKLFTESGLYAKGGIFSDLIQKIKHKILPPLQHEADLVSVINFVFDKPWDHKWVQEIPVQLWLELNQALEIKTGLTPQSNELNEILNSILIISHRIVVMGLDPVLVSKVPGISNLDSPFFQQNREITAYIDQIRANNLLPHDEIVEYKYILNTLDTCIQKLLFVHINRQQIGAGMGLTYLTRGLDQHVNRVKNLMKLLHEKKDQRERSIIRFFKEFVTHENTKHRVLAHFSSNIGLLAYQVTEHAAKTGEHYISSDKKEYFQFFLSSLGGGSIVALLVCIKLMIYYQHLPPFLEAFSNGLNYGIGFLIIHFAGFTLATKQPAMTASTLAEALDTDGEHTNAGISNLAKLIVKISRTQFVSFAGNLLMVFPITWLLSTAYTLTTGTHLADPEKATKLVHELHPFDSLSLWYAAIAGVLLFAAGLISGYFDNKTVFNHIPERIVKHPSLQWIHQNKREKIAAYIGNNLGSMAGNFILGMLLASMAFFGFILGLPLDVRHVTFVTGSFGLSLECLGNQLPLEWIIFTIISIFLIGFVNFIVSFSLAIYTAMSARKIKFSQTFTLLNLLKAYFFTYPFDFFFPPSKERQIELYEEPVKVEE